MMTASIENLNKVKKIKYMDISQGVPRTDKSVDKIDFKDKKVLFVSRSKGSRKTSKSLSDFIFGAVEIKTSAFYEKNELRKFDIVILDEPSLKSIEVFSANHDFSDLEQLIILCDFELNLPKVRSTIDFGGSWGEFAGKDIEYKVVKRQNPQEKILNIKSLKEE